MKYFQILFLILLPAICSQRGKAQSNDSTARDKSYITYSNDRTRYILGGVVIDGAEDYDPDLMLSVSGLTVGEIYDVPGDDISEAVRRFMKQKLFSSVRIETDSIIGSKIYLHIYLTPQPRISTISYSGLKKQNARKLNTGWDYSPEDRLRPT